MIKNAVLFHDREEAGRLLGGKLESYAGKNGIVFAIPRGGVAVGFYAAQHLKMPLDVVIPKKVGAPSNPEFALGAVMEDGTFFLNPTAPKSQMQEKYLAAEIKQKINEIKRRMTLYRGDKVLPDVSGKIVIIVDDGIATGATVFAALNYFKKKMPLKTVVAVPVAPADTIIRLQKMADDVCCVSSPELFFSVGQFYEDFHQVSDDEVLYYLQHNEELRRSDT